MLGAAQRQSAPAAMQRGRGEVDDSRLPSVSAVTGGDNDPSTGAASGGPNADVNAAQSQANRAAARDVHELSNKRCSRATLYQRLRRGQPTMDNTCHSSVIVTRPVRQGPEAAAVVI